MKHLWENINKNQESHFFCDEVPNAIDPEVLNQLSSKIPVDKYLWIACKSNLPPSRVNLESKFYFIIPNSKYSSNFFSKTFLGLKEYRFHPDVRSELLEQ